MRKLLYLAFILVFVMLPAPSLAQLGYYPPGPPAPVLIKAERVLDVLQDITALEHVCFDMKSSRVYRNDFAKTKMSESGHYS